MGYRRIVDIAKDVKKKLQEEYPDCKWSVTTKTFTGGRELNVYLMEAPFDVFASMKVANGFNEETIRERKYAQLNEYQLLDKFPNEERISNGTYLTQKGWDMLARAAEIMNEENWDRSDLMTDYFDVNYYMMLSIGKWDKPFKVT